MVWLVKTEYCAGIFLSEAAANTMSVIRQIKRCHFRQIKTGLLECLIMV